MTQPTLKQVEARLGITTRKINKAETAAPPRKADGILKKIKDVIKKDQSKCKIRANEKLLWYGDDSLR